MLATATSSPLISGCSGQDFSAGDFIDQQMRELSTHLQRSNILGFGARGVFRELAKTFNECGVDGWDGGDARAITKEVFWNAKTFLESFPWGSESPEIGAEPDGAISLEWYRSPSRVVSISINPGGGVYYAAIIGAKRRHGMDPVSFFVSDDLLDLIGEVAGEIE